MNTHNTHKAQNAQEVGAAVAELRAAVESIITSGDATLSAKEAAAYLKMQKSYLYKLTMRRDIPFYRPSGKKIVFYKSQLDAWIKRRGAVMTSADIDAAAADCLKKGGR